VWEVPGPDHGAHAGAVETFGELEAVADRLEETVREQLLAISPATIDRMLRPTKDARYPAAKSATRPGAALRSSIGVRQAMDEMEQAPGFFEIDLVAFCGHTLKGEHAWTLTATDVFLGWTRTSRSATVPRLQALYARTNPAELTRNINRIQQSLIASAKDKTLALRDQAS